MPDELSPAQSPSGWGLGRTALLDSLQGASLKTDGL